MAFFGKHGTLWRASRSPKTLFMAGVWYVLGKKMRARNMVRRVFPVLGFQQQNALNANRICEAHAAVSAEEEKAMREAIRAMVEPPLISIIMPVYNTDEHYLRVAIRSIREQIYPHWELCIADDASPSPHVRRVLEEEAEADNRIRVLYRKVNGHISRASNTALSIATGTFAAYMDHDDELPRHALYHVAKAIEDHPTVDLIYSDEDKILEDESLEGPHFKPDWNEELLLTQNYVNHLAVYRMSILNRIGGLRDTFEGSQDHDLVLRFSLETDPSRIVHIPKILYHWRAYDGSGSFSDRALGRAIEARQRAVRDYLVRRFPGRPMSVVRGPYGCNRVVRELPDPAPKVSIVIPTRDQADLLEQCLASVFMNTAYPDFEVIVVDNDSVETKTMDYFASVTRRYPVRVLAYSHPFNYSAINNLAVDHAKGEVVALLNNDVEVIGSQWLREMVSLAIQPEIGAVGARLRYGNGTVQHAGVILGVGGIANHAHHRYDVREPGYQSRLHLPQCVSAVTGACLVVEKEKYRKVGGLDADNLKIAFNDVDFCLKLIDEGLMNVYTPYADLYHHESLSRGADITPEKAERLERESAFMRGKWGSRLDLDPFYNPNFSMTDGQFRYRVG